MCIIVSEAGRKGDFMARSKKQKMVGSPPVYRSFKPSGVMRSTLEQIQLELSEYEAIRLADYEGLDHAEAATEMEISRPTFSRLIEKARGKMANFLIDGRELAIEGGNIHFRDNVVKCCNCKHMFNIRMGTGLKSCPECGSDDLVSFAGNFGHGRCCAEIGKNESEEKE